MKLSLDHLPATAQRLIEAIGLPATLALVKHFGGRTIMPPMGIQPAGVIRRAELEEAIGAEAAGRLAEAFREPVSIPLCTAALRAVDREALRDAFDDLTGRQAWSARAAVSHLARQHRTTERHVWRVLKLAPDVGAVADLAQMGLF